tara:strand:- start:2783 stop:3343 length:561 start_codon:yes stop_codon:yes gene_type:complete
MISKFEKKLKTGFKILGEVSIKINLNLSLKTEKKVYHWLIKNNEIKRIDNFIQNKKEFYKIEIKNELLKKYINNKCEFDDLFFGGHFRITTSKNGYNPILIKVFRYLNYETNLKLVKKKETSPNKETILVKFKNRQYKIKKFCPHQNYSLKKGIIDKKGIITCPAHGWKFNVVSGKCIKGDLTKKI